MELFEILQFDRCAKSVEHKKTAPYIFVCWNQQTVEFGTFYVKLRAGDNHKYRLISEVLGNRVLSKLGIRTPRICLVKIDEVVIDAAETSDVVKNILRENIGLNLGIENVPAAAECHSTHGILSKNISDTLTILAFDCISLNGDRRPENSNLLISANNIFPIDNEMCFAVVNENDILNLVDQNCHISYRNSIDRHICSEMLKSKHSECIKDEIIDEVCSRFRRVPEDFTDEVFAEIPREWRNVVDWDREEEKREVLKTYFIQVQRKIETIVRTIVHEVGTK